MSRIGERYSLGLLLCVGVCSLGAGDETLDFEAHVAPILREHCLRCHGENGAEGEFSLTSAASVNESGVIVAGKPSESTLLDVVKPSDGEPPLMPQEGRALSASEVSVLEQWIAGGAPWPDGFELKPIAKADASWWSLQPLRPGRHTSIDAYVREKLAEHEIKSAPRADPRTLIRRLSYDLHGLPPQPEDVERFVESHHPDAYKQWVERLLASHHYGERFAQHWLDIAHYADTHGFERDRRRDNAWRYRDYVIQSFNDDKPYPRFIQEQIAGDVLWPHDAAATIATGFLAAGPWDYVGQVETKSPMLRRSARSLDLDDMATQVISATLGLTLNCARCHDHKLDPITQAEYYRLRSVFVSLKREDRGVSDAALESYNQQRREYAEEWTDLDYQITRLEGGSLDLADVVGGGTGRLNGPPSQAEHYRAAIDPRSGKVQTRDFGDLGNVVPNHFSRSSNPLIDGVFVPSGGANVNVPISSTGLATAALPTTSQKAWDMIRNGPVASQHSPKLDGIDFSQGMNSLLGLHANAGITFDLAALGEVSGWTTLRLTGKVGYFGAAGAHRADAWVLVDGKVAAKFKQLGRNSGLQAIDLTLGDARFLTLISTDGGNGYSHDQIGFGNLRVRPVTPTPTTPDQKQQLDELRLRRVKLKQELEKLGPPPRFFGVSASAQPPEVRVLARGNPESPTGEPISPGALSCLTMLDADFGNRESGDAQRRAALAKWLTAPKNPLAARVIVNRLWQWHFGTGLVETPSDFGYGGGRPSHPELLDWLAQQLLDHDGSLKAIHRLILMSDTYQQASRYALPEAAAIDQDNRLLWRQNLRRLEAEAIRDAVLFVSGDLNLKQGGPGFEDFVYQDAYAPIYTHVTPDQPSLWRRSIYRYRVRTTPDRFLTTLDCPDPANLTPKRVTTTTPLQSLTMYNNDFMLQQSEHFASRLKRHNNDPSRQVTRGFWLAFGREPNQRELRLGVRVVRDAGLFTFCRSLINANEFIYVD